MIKFKSLLNASLQEGNESNTHVRLTKELKEYAYHMDYQDIYEGFPKDKIPDVLLHNGRGYLFMGDAKVSRNETAGRAETARQISEYIDIFLKLVDEKTIYGGFIAIISDAKQAVADWNSWLIAECEQKGCIYRGQISDTNMYINENVAFVFIEGKQLDRLWK